MKVKKFLILIPFVLFILFVTSLSLFSQFLGSEKNKEKERFIVKLDSSEEQIITDLKEKGFLKNKTIFSLILTFKNWHNKIQPGAYMISKSMNAYELAGTMIYGPFQKWVLIPPGKRKEQVALILQKSLDWPFSLARSFTNIAEEGYLFPDTYLIDTDADPQQVVQKLKNNFNEKFDSQLQKDLLAQNIRNDTAVKIASLIERESGGAEDKPIIAGIIWNRLNKKMKLEIDATVQYAIASKELDDAGLQTLENFDFWPKVTGNDLRTTISPYNTYKIKALPPGPICSPSLASLKAVAYPAETDALYYLHSPDKQIHTAKTYKEHKENIEKYLK